MRLATASRFIQRSQSILDAEVLVPNVERFNEFLKVPSDMFAGLRMWHYTKEVRSGNDSTSPNAQELCKEGVFIFLGY